ncbi:MAG: hypothetical protein P8P49_12065 [Opitutales bacterium]|nr:hypothetical protein [Opitutales bacterium]
MEQLNFKHFRRTLHILSVLFFVFQVSALDTKRFDSPPPARGQYLAFSKPITLRYGTSQLPVDRRKLIMTPISQITVTTVTRENNESENSIDSGFPLFPSPDKNSSSQIRPTAKLFQNLPNVAPPVALPLSDPFEEVNSIGINSTDELLQVFESSTFSSPRSSIQDIPFVPPYTVAPDNMRVSSGATYQRRQR